MKTKTIILAFLVNIVLVSCVPASMPAPTVSPSIITPDSTVTSSPEPTASPTITPTPILHSVSFKAFYDLNGNGSVDLSESSLQDIEITLGTNGCKTDISGGCVVKQIPEGNATIMLFAPENFQYLTPDIYTELPIAQGMEVKVTDDITFFIPLVEGPYRSPFHGLDKIYIGVWTDLDTKSCFTPIGDRKCQYRLDWRGGKNTYDRHDGTDFWLGTNKYNVYPMRSGTVVEAKPVGNQGFSVLILDKKPVGSGDSYQSYVHLNTLLVTVNQKVDPNTVLGVGGSQAIGGGLHINPYINVPHRVHPASPDSNITGYNPYVVDPFAENLWTGGLASLGKIVIEISSVDPGNEGAFGKQTQIYP
jgi:hypothetical protein